MITMKIVEIADLKIDGKTVKDVNALKIRDITTMEGVPIKAAYNDDDHFHEVTDRQYKIVYPNDDKPYHVFVAGKDQILLDKGNGEKWYSYSVTGALSLQLPNVKNYLENYEGSQLIGFLCVGDTAAQLAAYAFQESMGKSIPMADILNMYYHGLDITKLAIPNPFHVVLVSKEAVSTATDLLSLLAGATVMAVSYDSSASIETACITGVEPVENTEELGAQLAGLVNQLKMYTLDIGGGESVNALYINDTEWVVATISAMEATHRLLNKGVPVEHSMVGGDTVDDFNFTIETLDTDIPEAGRTFLAIDQYVAPTQENKRGTLVVQVCTCLSGNTLISMADGSVKRLDQMRVGDMVLTPFGGERVIYTDSALHKTRDDYTVYEFTNGAKLTVIKDHRVYSREKRKCVHISTLKIGDEVVLAGGQRARLKSRTHVTEPINHYTIFTENRNQYYANGVLCGNIFSNIKPRWVSRALARVYVKLVSRREK